MEENQNPSPMAESLASSVPEPLRPAFEFLLKNIKPIVIGLAAILVITFATGLYSTIQSKRTASANDDLGVILASTQGADKIAKLEAFLPEAPSGLAKSVITELAYTCMQQKDYSKAEKYWNDLAAQSEQMNVVAKIGAAKCQMLAGKSAEAVKSLEALQASAPEAYKNILARELAEAAQLAGDKELAIEQFEALLANSEPQEKQYIEYRIRLLKK
ncbi:MAG: tetratricopeptide repeat protein [Desulfovibrio sp.]